MKKQKTAKTDLGIALNVLACYQSYCLRTGATHETLAKAMCSDDAQGVINEYLDVLKHERKCVLTSFTSDRINKIVDIIASVPDGKSVALGLVVLNAHLQKMYGSMCIMSQYDLSLMIDVVSDVESQSEKIDNGTINYYCTQEENTKLKKKIILNSIRPICELKRMCQQDSILQAMYVWLFTSSGMIDCMGVKSKPLHNAETDSFTKHIRDGIVFTSLVSPFDKGCFETKSTWFIYGCLDMVSILLFSLPIVSARKQSIPVDNARRNIAYEGPGNTIQQYIDTAVYLKQFEEDRRLRVGDILAKTHHTPGDDRVELIISSRNWAYSVMYEAKYLMGFEHAFSDKTESISAIGKHMSEAYSSDYPMLTRLLEQTLVRPISYVSEGMFVRP